MTKTTRTRLLLLIWGIGILSTPFYIWSRAERGLLSISDLGGIYVFIAFGTVGSLIVARQPRNPVGWTFFAFFCHLIATNALEAFLTFYADWLATALPTLASALTFVFVFSSGSLSVIIWYSLLIFPILYFPNGELPSRRWRFVLRALVASLILKLLAGIFNPDLTSPMFPDFQNPFSVPGFADIWEALDVILILVYPLVPLSLLLRFRRSQGIEREQIKWPMLSSLLGGIAFGWYLLVGAVLGGFNEQLAIFRVALYLEVLSVLTFPLSIGIGILRYRLYDIDLLINRTLVYGVLTTLLAAVYYAGVLLIQQIFPAESQISVVVSTLTVVVLFSPLRRRLQLVIDRRFYRQRYDAQRTLAQFSGALREHVDLEQISASLLKVIQETVQPEFVSLWLRQKERR